MNTYEIIMTPDATTDLLELRNYIADVLLVPDTYYPYRNKKTGQYAPKDSPSFSGTMAFSWCS